MEIALVVIGLLVLLWFRQFRIARKVTALRARELSSETGIPVDEIEREILQRRITPGDWAREHGLDPLTFRRAGGSSGSGFGERELAEPDWSEVTGLFSGSEQRLSSCSGWTVSLTDPINHPASLYLTDAALYVSVRPDTLLPNADARRWAKERVVACDTAQQPDGGTRLMVALSHDSTQTAQPLVLAVDLRPLLRGPAFAREVSRWLDVTTGAAEDSVRPAARSTEARPPGRSGRLPIRPRKG